ncbi:MAG TPA: sigma-70 family RNA polymerase sigma factor [Herpetosiphonaceae bacterium]|nr:sigma-70 family RNA polymerase sigma factor [Herpetosiphonaceae bacterium]
MSGRAQLRDDELLQLIAGGDEQALGALYDRYGRLVFSIALRVTDDRSCAEDVTQDVFHRVWTHAYGFSLVVGSAAGWIIGITRHRAIDEIRSRRHKGRQREVWLDDLPTMACRDSGDDEEHVELRCEVRAALATLAQEQRQAIELVYYRGLTATEIASMAAIPVGTVKSRLRYGLTALRGVLRQDTGDAKPEAFAPERQM